jgi:hypothetical protein
VLCDKFCTINLQYLEKKARHKAEHCLGFQYIHRYLVICSLGCGRGACKSGPHHVVVALWGRWGNAQVTASGSLGSYNELAFTASTPISGLISSLDMCLNLTRLTFSPSLPNHKHNMRTFSLLIPTAYFTIALAQTCYLPNTTPLPSTGDFFPAFQPCTSGGPLTICCATNRTRDPGGDARDGEVKDECLPNGLCQNRRIKNGVMMK